MRQYRNILKPTGQLHFKTDSKELFLWSLEQFKINNWQILELEFDLHKSDLPEDYKIQTAYEARYIEQNTPINYCAIIKLDK